MRIKFLQDIKHLDLKVIHLVRDERGGASSYMKHGGRDVASATRAWYHANMNAERARRFVSPDQWLRIKYDDLADNPQGILDQISDFLNVERAPIPKIFSIPNTMF